MAVLDVCSLSKRFGVVRPVRAVDDVSFTVEAGQIFGLLGTNGSGKTTTLACVLGLQRPSAGSSRVLGVPSARLHATRGKVGAVFDSADLLTGLTVRANLEYARRLLGHDGGRSSDEAARLVGIEDLLGRRAGKLSLGQAKRVTAARALLGRPELLVFDEPLSALDTLGVRAMLELLRELAREGVTLVLSSHRLHEMEGLITHAGILARGRLVACAPLSDLLGAGDRLVRVSLAPVERAERVLAGELEAGRIARAERTEERGARKTGASSGERGASAGAGEWLVELSPAADPAAATVGALNRVLVEAGCDVNAIVPERSDLLGRFEALVAEAAR